ncbi:MAG: ATP-grasp domain-containing protein [Clostridia bacterium]|nr:ATP-grasp domain-containing protein [Clostridia bacterium]
MKVRIWFNHWFSAVYQIIRMMREGCAEELEVIGSNRRESTVYKCQCDEWYVEPDKIDDAAYVDYCLDFCREHRIDVFVPRRGLTEIAAQAERFEAAGVKLLVGVQGEMVRRLDDKIAAYELLRQSVPECIPVCRVANSLAEFEAACQELTADGSRVCYKLGVDEGARSFRVVDDRVLQPRALYEKPGFKLTLEQARTVLAQYDFSIPVLLMPYLEGPEISVDCMQCPDRKLIIPRYKMAGRYSEIRFDEDVLALSARLMDAVGADLPVNIQFRMHGGQLYLLEINPRMSGGVQLSCEATGINLPAIALNQLLGHATPWQQPEGVSRVAHVEKPVRLV